MALISRFLYNTASQSCSYSTFHLRRHFSVERVRNVWISGLMDPSNAKSKCILYKDPYEKRHVSLQREDSIYSDLWADYIANPAAITFLNWKNYKINIVHTPDRVDDFTLEVENALCSFDCAIHVLSSVGEVQSQSISVDKHMIRYQLPRLLYINKLNKKGANPWEVLNQARSKFQHHSAAIQVPIGLEGDFKGLVDLVQLKAYTFHRSNGGNVVIKEVPTNMEALVLEKRHELIKTVSEVDDKLAEALCSDTPISATALEEAVRRATIARKFIPVFMGSAFKYKHKLVALAFTLNRKHQLKRTYLRIYKGVIRRGDYITNVHTGKTFQAYNLTGVPYDTLIQEAHAGEIIAIHYVYDVSGDPLTDGIIRSTKTRDIPELRRRSF